MITTSPKMSGKPRLMDIVQDTWLAFLWIVKVMNSKKRQRNPHRPERPGRQDDWRECSIWIGSWNKENTNERTNQTWWNLNRIQNWVNSTVPMLVPKLWQMYWGPTESPLDCKEIKPVHPRGKQPWLFTRRNDAEAETPILWPPDAKSWLIRKDSDAGKHWGQEEKGTTEDEMVGWHHWLSGHESEWTPGDGGQGSLVCCSPQGHKEFDMTKRLNSSNTH